MKSLNKKENKENNKAALYWVFKRVKRYLPRVALLSLIAMADALIFVALALVSKNVLDIATNAKDGNLFGAGFMIFGIIFVHILLLSLQSFLNAHTNAKMHISMRNYLFSQISRKKYSRKKKRFWRRKGNITGRCARNMDGLRSVSIILSRKPSG